MDREVDATSVGGGGESHRRRRREQLDGRDSRRPRSAHLHPTNRRWALRSATHGNALQTAPHAAPSWHLSPPPLPSSHHDLLTARGRTWRGGGPTFLCKRVPGGRAWMELCQKECSRSRGTRELCLMCLMHRVCGRAQASTDSGRRAPFALGDDDERVTRGLRIEGLAAAAGTIAVSR